MFRYLSGASGDISHVPAIVPAGVRKQKGKEPFPEPGGPWRHTRLRCGVPSAAVSVPGVHPLDLVPQIDRVLAGDQGRPRRGARAEPAGVHQAADAAGKPFIYLSAGVSNDAFTETLHLAAEAGIRFSGVLCGRATWQDGIPVFAQKGPDAFRHWLESDGVRNIEAVNACLDAAVSWYSFYNVQSPEALNPQAIVTLGRFSMAKFFCELHSTSIPFLSFWG